MALLIEDTIAAISTPLGKSGIGVIRLSGKDSLKITESILLSRKEDIEDLVQAEAVRDLIEAKTLFQAKVAHQQAAGSLSRRLKPVKNQLIQLISVLEAGVDFAEDDVPVMAWEEIRERLVPIDQELKHLHSSFSYGKIVTTGLTLAIMGRPNVGKS